MRGRGYRGDGPKTNNTAVCFSREFLTRCAAPKGTTVREEKRERKLDGEKGRGTSIYIVGRGSLSPWPSHVGLIPTWLAGQGGAAAPPTWAPFGPCGFPLFYFFLPLPLIGLFPPEGPLVE